MRENGIIIWRREQASRKQYIKRANVTDKGKGDYMNMEAKTVSESLVETVHVVRPNHLNGANRLFGGILMQWIDEVAAIVAKRHCNCNVTTASVDNLTFLQKFE